MVSASLTAASASAARYEISAPGPGLLMIVASLPGLASAAEADLSVSVKEVRIRSLRPDCPHSLDVPLPVPVHTDEVGAKWSKRTQQLTIRLKRLRADVS